MKKNKNFILDKDEFKQGKSSEQGRRQSGGGGGGGGGGTGGPPPPPRGRQPLPHHFLE